MTYHELWEALDEAIGQAHECDRPTCPICGPRREYCLITAAREAVFHSDDTASFGTTLVADPKPVQAALKAMRDATQEFFGHGEECLTHYLYEMEQNLLREIAWKPENLHTHSYSELYFEKLDLEKRVRAIGEAMAAMPHPDDSDD